jgi:hypothetical protein
MMPAPRIKFSDLRQILSDLGFKRFPVKKPLIGFCHDEASASLMFPAYRGNSWLAVHRLLQARVLLDAKGLMHQDEFDRLVTEAAARHPATNRPGAPNPDGQIHRRKA